MLAVDQVIGDWQSSSPLITNNPNNAIAANNPSSPIGPGQNNGWFDWHASNGGDSHTNDAGDTITVQQPRHSFSWGLVLPTPYYNYQTTPAAAVSIGTQALRRTRISKRLMIRTCPSKPSMKRMARETMRWRISSTTPNFHPGDL